MLKGDLQASYVPRHALYQHNLGPLKIALAEATYLSKPARSLIGNWRIKTWARQTTVRTCMKSLTRLDPS
jgi:hypothetical protein